MAKLQIEKIEKELKEEGLDDAQSKQAISIMKANLPVKTLTAAIHYLGWATLLLVVGCIVLPYYDKTPPEAIWGALGAGIGAMAGIFVDKK